MNATEACAQGLHSACASLRVQWCECPCHLSARRARLEELRTVLRSESMSWGELAELQALEPWIAAGDVELLEAAGVPEEQAREEGRL